MKQLLVVLLSIYSVNLISQNLQFEDNIKKMLEIQGIIKNWEATIPSMIELQKKANPEIDPEFWNRLEKELIENSDSILVEMIIPIYKKHLTEKEVKSIIEFYESEVGKSLISKTPILLQESIDAGIKLGAQLASQITEEIEHEKTLNYDSVKTGCESVKIGKFKSYLKDSSIVIIKRDEKFQYAYYNGTTTKYKVIWLDECRYSLSIVKTDNKYMREAKGEILIVNIYETGSDYYKYVSTIEESGIKKDGIVYKVE